MKNNAAVVIFLAAVLSLFGISALAAAIPQALLDAEERPIGNDLDSITAASVSSVSRREDTSYDGEDNNRSDGDRNDDEDRAEDRGRENGANGNGRNKRPQGGRGNTNQASATLLGCVPILLPTNPSFPYTRNAGGVSRYAIGSAFNGSCSPITRAERTRRAFEMVALYDSNDVLD